MVIPLGVKNAGTTYQHAMTAIFYNMHHGCLEDYVDDIVMKSREISQQVDNSRMVFLRCKQYNLRMNTDEFCIWHFFRQILGFIVYKKCVDLNLAKAKTI